METFPLKPDVEIEKEYIDPVIAVTFENGVEQIRQRWSKPKILFRLHFANISSEDRNSLESFYQRNRLNPFKFTYEGKTYTVRFNSPLKTKQIAPLLFSATAELIEAWGVEL